MLGVGIPQHKVKADTHANLVAGWLRTIGGIIGVVPTVLPGWPFLLLGMSTLSKRYGWARRVTTWLHSFFVDQATPRKTEKGTEDFHVAVGNPTFRRRHNYLV
jgi:hypothetical protein